MMVVTVGMVCFGVLIGFITYRTLIRTAGKTSIHDLTVVVAAIGGGAVTTLARPVTNAFGWYAIGLLGGFAGYAILYWALKGKTEFAKVMNGSDDIPPPVQGLGAPRKP
jgi:hypothetical protein